MSRLGITIKQFKLKHITMFVKVVSIRVDLYKLKVCIYINLKLNFVSL